VHSGVEVPGLNCPRQRHPAAGWYGGTQQKRRECPWQMIYSRLSPSRVPTEDLGEDLISLEALVTG
jgi:hypothetical protein